MTDPREYDRTFQEVAHLLSSAEEHWAATIAARNVWICCPGGDDRGSLIGVVACPPGQRPDDPAFVPLLAPARAFERAVAQLAATAVVCLLPAVNDPALFALKQRKIEELLGMLLDHTLAHVGAIARDITTLGMVWPGEEEGV